MAAKKKAAPKATDFRATAEEAEAVRSGDATADGKKSAPNPHTATPVTTRLVAVEVEEERTSASDTSLAKVIDVANVPKTKGARVIDVVATRHGHYGLARKRPGETFQMGIVGKGYLPSWVKLANDEDMDPEVSRSRQVERNSTGEEIRADVARDAGTAVPTYLGGTQRLSSNEVI